jgi:small redox-active disulfide protein 2
MYYSFIRLFDYIRTGVCSLIVQIAGTGCAKCQKLYELAVEATGDLGIVCDVVKVDKVKEIVLLGVMTTPALLVDGKILLAGNVPTMEKLKEILQPYCTK